MRISICSVSRYKTRMDLTSRLLMTSRGLLSISIECSPMVIAIQLSPFVIPSRSPVDCF